MAVLFKNAHFAILDHEKWILDNVNFGRTENGSHEVIGTPGELISKLFDVRTPFLMDGAAKKEGQRMEERATVSQNCDNFSTPQNRRKRKNSLEVDPAIEREVDMIRKKFDGIVQCEEFKTIFSYVVTPQDYFDNNTSSRSAASRVASQTCFLEYPSTVNNLSADSFNAYHCGNEFIIPPHSKGHCIDVTKTDLTKLLNKKQFKIISIDPPWYNKHVKRVKKTKQEKGYAMLSVDEILSLPMKDMLSTKGVILIWCTNNSSILSDFKNQLSDAWNITVLQTWYWIKLTKSGSLIKQLSTDINSKRPYERILVAVRKDCLNLEEIKRKLPQSDPFLICSTPSALHSHKPPLNDLLNSLGLITKETDCLEVFSRYLVPGWTSVGLEVTKLQLSSLYT